MSKNKDGGSTEAVLQYLRKQNRPYSAVDVLNNLHKQYGKTAVQKSLDQLVSEGNVKEKSYGKQKVYVADQMQLPATDDRELKEMEEKINTLTENLKATQTQLKESEIKYTSLSSSLTTAEVVDQISENERQIKRLKEKLEQLTNNPEAVNPVEKERIVAEHTKYVTAWRKRKKMAMEMLNSILENYPGDKKTLCEQVGLELDEDVGVAMPK